MNEQKSFNQVTDKEEKENNIETLYLQKITQLKVDVQKYNDSAYKAKREIARLQADLDKFNAVAYKAKKEINRLNSVIKQQNIYIQGMEQKLLHLLDKHNQLLVDYDNDVEEMERKVVTLSYDVGQAFLKLNTLRGMINFIPNILHARREHKKRLEQKTEVNKKKVYLLKNEYFLTGRREYIAFITGTSKDKTLPISRKLDVKFLESMAINIPDSNGITYFKKIPINVAIVTDEFMFNYYNGVFENLFYITPDNYIQVFDNNRIDAFLYVSCWSGISNDEWRGIKFRERSKLAFEGILNICKNRSITTIFQTIEDPSNYDNFLPIAKQFDYIFTSAAEKIDDYKVDCNNVNVSYLEYGFNPSLNNPIGIYREVIDGVFFAGSYPARYVERCKDMQVMFSNIKKTMGELVIADRNSNLKDEKLKFPLEYRDNTIPAIQHKLLQKVHKLFRYNANFNSIKDSITMCAMRVYELQAQGTLILSNYALSVSNKFPNIKIITQSEDISPLFKGNKKISVDELVMRVNTLRRIWKDKSVFDQTTKMLQFCGFDVAIIMPSVLVIKLDDMVMFPQQTYSNYVVFNKENIEKNLEKIDYVCCVSSDNQYSVNYLQDLLNGFKYVDVDYITQSAIIDHNGNISGIVFDYVDSPCEIGKSMVKFSAFDLDNIQVKSRKGFAVEPFGLDFYCSNTQETQKELSIIIPVYNNGLFLRDRCFSSLKLDANFNRFEIILVDDGSDEEETLKIIEQIEKQYSNVRTFKYPVGGSGSASRARNKGLELSTTNYVTYLDPDNEISMNGYSSLLSILKEQIEKGVQADFITGYQNKITDKGEVVHTACHTDKELVYIENTKDFLIEKNYRIISTQAFVCKKKLLVNNQINFVENAVGQDTLFAFEILAYSNGGFFTNSAYINYYAERKNSVTNTLTKKFFEKSLILEKEQVTRLKRLGLFEHYKKNKFPPFYEGWYLKKILEIDEIDRSVCLEILDKIKELYV